MERLNTVRMKSRISFIGKGWFFYEEAMSMVKEIENLCIVLKDLEGIKRFLSGEKIGVSSDISEKISYGYGDLDDDGFWEFPVPESLVKNYRKAKLFDQYKEVLEGLTPGGSEYVGDPERCATVIRKRFAEPITILKRQLARLDAVEKMVKALEDSRVALLQSEQTITVQVTLETVVSALSAWKAEEKGKDKDENHIS